MFNLIKKLQSPYIRNPITGICKCGHKWSWHYLEKINGNCYAHKITGSKECVCKGYGE